MYCTLYHLDKYLNRYYDYKPNTRYCGALWRRMNGAGGRTTVLEGKFQTRSISKFEDAQITADKLVAKIQEGLNKLRRPIRVERGKTLEKHLTVKHRDVVGEHMERYFAAPIEVEGDQVTSLLVFRSGADVIPNMVLCYLP